MIFKEVSTSTYRYIVNTELLFITEFHMNPLELFGDMTLLDFQSYINGIEHNLKKKNARYSNSKHLATLLFMLKQVLNSMDL